MVPPKRSTSPFRGAFARSYTLPPTPIHEQDELERKEELDNTVGFPWSPNVYPPKGVVNGRGVFSGRGVSWGAAGSPMPEISQEVGVHTFGRLRCVAVDVGICTVEGKDAGGKGFRGERGFAKIVSAMINATKTTIKIPAVRILKKEARDDPGFDEKENFTSRLSTPSLKKLERG